MQTGHIHMGRRLLARAAILASLASAAGGALAMNATTAGATTYTVTLTAGSSSPAVGQTVLLQAEVTPNPSGSGLRLSVYNEYSHQLLADCGTSWLCDTQDTKYDNNAHHYIAYLAGNAIGDPPSGVVAQSSLLTVTWAGTWTWTDTLSASDTNPVAGTSTTLNFRANGNTSFEGDSNELFDVTANAFIAGCPSGTCSRNVTSTTPQTRQYQAKIVDGSGSVIATSNILSVTWQPYYSDRCTAPLLTVVDGWVAGTYARVRVQQNGGSTVVCYRVDQGGTLDGGQIVVNPGAATVGLPSTDANDTACATSSGNQVPGPHPLLSASTPSGNVVLDSYVTTGSPSAWICVTAGPVHQRILVPVSASGTPVVANNVDPIAQQPPAPDAGPAGYPSSSCVAGGGSAATQYVAATAGATHEWLSVWQRTANELDVCVRVQGPETVGGLFTIGVPVGVGSITVPPVIGVGTDTSPCTFAFAVGSPVSAMVATSPPGSDPLVVCAGAVGTSLAVTVGVGLGQPPVQLALPSFTPDPDSI
jgi:hypothetical protein